MTATTVITLNVHMRAAAGQEDELAAALHALIDPTRAEAGCLNYDLHRDPNDQSRFMFYENWKDQEALDTHIATPHIKKFLDQTTRLLAEPMQMTSWHRVG